MEQPGLDELVRQCRSGDPRRQVEAVHALQELRLYESLPAVRSLLESPYIGVRSAAAHALGELGQMDADQAGTALQAALSDVEGIVRSAAVDSLGILGYAGAVDEVRSLLANDPDPLVRAAAAETLGDLEDVESLPDLELSLKDEDESVRAYAVNSMGLLGTSSTAATLRAQREAEPSPRVQAEMLGAGYRLGAHEDIGALLRILDSADEDLAVPILNLIDDLTARKMPPTLAADAPRIRRSLESLAERFPIQRSFVMTIVANLPDR